MRTLVSSALLCLCLLMPRNALADGFITPFVGYNFGGDSGNCASLTDCNERRLNLGLSIGSLGRGAGFEVDVSWAKNFFGESPDAENSVFSAMGSVLFGSGVGRVQPYFLIGVGLIRPHVTFLGVDSDENAVGYDIGGGITAYFSRHVGIRGDLRRFRTFEDVDVGIFTGENLEFWRVSIGLALK